MIISEPTAAQSLEDVYLVGVRMWPAEDSDLLYTLLLMDEDSRGGKDRPLTDSEGYIVWFTAPSCAAVALSYGDEGFRRHGVPDEVAFVYDYARLFWSVTTCDNDDGAVVLNGVNLLLDLAEAITFPVPERYGELLGRFANGLTLSSDLAAVLVECDVSRQGVMEALCWCVGAVTIKSRSISPPVESVFAEEP